jgi:uncharacterized protein (DUF433 family)
MAAIEKRHIVLTPGVLGGKPRIEGTRIAVEHIAIAYNSGQSIDEIVESYQGITHADVFAALAYYYDHKEEMDAKIKHDDKAYEKLYQENLKQTSSLRKQLKERGKKKSGITSAD